MKTGNNIDLCQKFLARCILFLLLHEKCWDWTDTFSFYFLLIFEENFWDIYIIYNLPFFPLIPPTYSTLLSFMLMASVFINCYYMRICIYIHIVPSKTCLVCSKKYLLVVKMLLINQIFSWSRPIIYLLKIISWCSYSCTQLLMSFAVQTRLIPSHCMEKILYKYLTLSAFHFPSLVNR